MRIGANWPYDPPGRNAPEKTWQMFAALKPQEVTVPSHISPSDVARLIATYPNLMWHIRVKGNRKWFPDNLYAKEWANEFSPIELVQTLHAAGVEKPCIILMNEVDIELTEDWKADDANTRRNAISKYLAFVNEALDNLFGEFGPAGSNYDVALSPLSEGGPDDRFLTWWNAFKDAGLLLRITRVVDHCYFADKAFDDQAWGSRYKIIQQHWQGPIDITETNDNGALNVNARANSYTGYLYYLRADSRIESVSLFTLPGGARGADWWWLTQEICDAVGLVPRDNAPITPPVIEPPGTVPIVNSLNPWEYWSADEISATTQCIQSNVERYWPVIHEALTAHSIAQRNVQAAVLGTIAIETASRFEPIDEYKNADGSIPSYWYNYDGGPDYHGRGFIQLTHKYNYALIGLALGFDLVNDPDLAKDPFVASMVLAHYCNQTRGTDNKSVAESAMEQDWEAVRRKVQGGTAGLPRLIQVGTDLLAKPYTPPVIPPIEPEHIPTREEELEALVTAKQAQINNIVGAFAQVCDVWAQQMIKANKDERKILAAVIAKTREDVIGKKPV